MSKSIVYHIKEISPSSLVRIYEVLGRKLRGKVAVKISTGEMGGNNYLHPELIGELVDKLDARSSNAAPPMAVPGRRRTSTGRPSRPMAFCPASKSTSWTNSAKSKCP